MKSISLKQLYTAIKSRNLFSIFEAQGTPELNDVKKELKEANLRQLYTKSINETPKLAQRGQKLVSEVRYFGLSKDGTLNFKIRSQTQKGGFYYAYIEAPDILKFSEVVEEGDHFVIADLNRLLTMNGFRIHCSDPSFLYYAFQYMATQGNYEIEPETRAPKRNNVLLQGALCFTGETQVLTSEGFKQIKDIVPGDYVYSHKGRLCRVTDTGSRLAKTRRIKIGTRWVETTDEHPFLTVGINSHHDLTKVSWVKAKDLTHDSYRVLTPYLKNESKQEIPYNLAFILGLYLGDGTARLHYRDNEIKRSKYPIIDKTKQFDKISICIDKRFKDTYIKKFDSLGIFYTYNELSDTNNGYIDIQDPEVIKFIYKYAGLTHKGKFSNYKKFIHKECLTWGKESKLGILLGFFWADGSFSLHDNYPEMYFSNTNKEIADKIYIMLKEFCNPSYVIYKRKETNVTNNPKDMYDIFINGPVIKDLLDREPDTLKIKWRTLTNEIEFSKRITNKQIDNYLAIPVYNNEETQEEKVVYNLSVDGDDSYLVTTNCYAVHNCKHLVALVYNLYNNNQMREQISKDIDNYLRMIVGLDYEDYQQLNHARQIQQQNRAVKWKNKPSDFMNDYFARKAKTHPFLDDHDIKHSLKVEGNKFIKANPQASVDDFLREYFGMTQKAFAEDMQLPENAIEDYFNELGFEKARAKGIAKQEEKLQQSQPTQTTNAQGVKSGIVTKDSEQLKEAWNDYDSHAYADDVTEQELNNNPCSFVTYGSAGRTENKFKNIKEVFKYVQQCGGFRQFKGIQWAIVSEYKGGEFYYQRNSLASSGWSWIDVNGDKVKYKEIKLLRDLHEAEEPEYLTYQEAVNKYTEYLNGHIQNVQDAMELIIKTCSDKIPFIKQNEVTLRNIAKQHDSSKWREPEWSAYLHHFYPTDKADTMKSEEFEQACRHHINYNKHHWDYWVDEFNQLKIPMEDTYKLYCVERVCDWLAMAKQHGEDKSLWYECNKEAIIMPDYAFDLIDEIYKYVPDDFYLNLTYGGIRGELDEAQDNATFSNEDRSDIYVHTKNLHHNDGYVPALGYGYYLYQVNSVSSLNKPVEEGNNEYYKIRGGNFLTADNIDSQIDNLPRELTKEIADKLQVDQESIQRLPSEEFLLRASQAFGKEISKIMISNGVDGFIMLDASDMYGDEDVKNETIIYNMSVLEKVTPDSYNESEELKESMKWDEIYNVASDALKDFNWHLESSDKSTRYKIIKTNKNNVAVGYVSINYPNGFKIKKFDTKETFTYHISQPESDLQYEQEVERLNKQISNDWNSAKQKERAQEEEQKYQEQLNKEVEEELMKYKDSEYLDFYIDLQKKGLAQMNPKQLDKEIDKFIEETYRPTSGMEASGKHEDILNYIYKKQQ